MNAHFRKIVSFPVSSIMNSDAAHETKESNPSDDNSLNVTLLPQNISENMLFQPNADFILEWNHERNKVPELLVSHGVPIELWQKLFDQVNILWKDRIDNVASTKNLMPWSKYCFLISMLCLFFSVVLRFVPNEHEASWMETIREISAYFLAFIPFIYLLCCVIHIQIIYYNLIFGKTDEEAEKAWIDFVSNLNTGKCQQLGLHVKILRYHLYMNGEGNKYYVPIGIQFSALSSESMLSNDLNKTLASPSNTSFRFEPQNIENYSIFSPGKNFKVEFNHERHEIPTLLQHHGITLHLWQHWCDIIQDLWAKRVSYTRFAMARATLFEFSYFVSFFIFCVPLSFTISVNYVLPLYILVSIFAINSLGMIFMLFLDHFSVPILFKDDIEDKWLQFVSDLRDNKCKKYGLNVDAIQNEICGTVGLEFSKIISNEDVQDLESHG
jgi:hypothetical protein